ncbi:MAG TPA: ABC transporter substrate-binding protein [Bacillota bacterium]|nr:ABC transporter substrate-binding protein [Peptococcaceae bacterium MAG4]HPZ44367.1 ABC transporter substrate-binding protein [Bacillota bacterium]HQD76979.1 ABC transporter substrate-binding protein [Bacillota bacterium]HUM59772.1 ABC transporter substrate-binding protein [Bacillota bacterium]
MRFLKSITMVLLLMIPLLLLVNTNVIPVTAKIAGRESPSLIYVREQDSITLDPAWAQDEESCKVISNIFEGLVRFKAGSTEVEPCLAESWKVSSDNMVWTFYLRKDVKFHDGTPFNAEAVRFSLERQMLSQDGSSLNYASFTFGMVEQIKVIDPYTVSFILKYPYAPFLNNLAMAASAPIVSPTAATALGDAFSENPVGTGPYRFVRWDKGKRIILKANSDYWGGPPECSTLVFKVVKNSRLRSLLIRFGLADITDGITAADARYLEQKGCRVLRSNGLDLSYLGFYNDKEPFNNPALRRAVSLAIDRKQLTEKLYRGNAVEAGGPLPPGVLGYDPESRPLPYDPAGSREILASQNLAGGLKITIITYTNQRPYNPAGGQKLAEAIQADLAAVGIETEIKAYPWHEYKEALLKEEGNAFLYGWISDNGDPDNFLYTLLSSAQIESGLNTARYRNREVDLLLARAQQSADLALREQLYREATKIIIQDAPWVCLNHSLRLTAVAPGIEGFVQHKTGYPYLHGVKKVSRQNFFQVNISRLKANINYPAG